MSPGFSISKLPFCQARGLEGLSGIAHSSVLPHAVAFDGVIPWLRILHFGAAEGLSQCRLGVLGARERTGATTNHREEKLFRHPYADTTITVGLPYVVRPSSKPEFSTPPTEHCAALDNPELIQEPPYTVKAVCHKLGRLVL